MIRLFWISLLILLPQHLFAHCQTDALAKKDQAYFNEELRMTKERVAGYQGFVEEKRKLEAKRLAGVKKLKELRAEEQRTRAAVAQKFGQQRTTDLAQRRSQMVHAWREQAKRERGQEERRNCAREAFIKVRDQFRVQREQILENTEGRELDVTAR